MDGRIWTAGTLALAGLVLAVLTGRRCRRAAGGWFPPSPPPDPAGDREPRRPLPTSGAGVLHATPGAD